MHKRKISILFIDDNVNNNVLTQAIIEAEEMPIESYFAQSIDEAIIKLNDFEKEQYFPQFVFCDINLPIKNGYFFAEYYLAHFYEKNKDVRVYFMSADFQQEDFDKLTQFPFVYNVVLKPFSREIFDEATKNDSEQEE